jgi:hypothetical protein
MSASTASTPPFDFSRLPRAFLEGVIWVLTRVIMQRGRKVTTAWTVQNEKADPGDPKTWASFEAASATLERNPDLFDGLAIVLGNGGTGAYRVALALHNCIDEHGTVADWAERITSACDTYTERTSSGRGLRMFFVADADTVRAAPALFGYPASQSGCHRAISPDGATLTISFANGVARATGHVVADDQTDVAELDIATLRRLAQLVAEAAGKPGSWQAGRGPFEARPPREAAAPRSRARADRPIHGPDFLPCRSRLVGVAPFFPPARPWQAAAHRCRPASERSCRPDRCCVPRGYPHREYCGTARVLAAGCDIHQQDARACHRSRQRPRHLGRERYRQPGCRPHTP